MARPPLVITPYFDGRLAPIRRAHPHRMREIVRNERKVLLACADCAKTETVPTPREET